MAERSHAPSSSLRWEGGQLILAAAWGVWPGDAMYSFFWWQLQKGGGGVSMMQTAPLGIGAHCAWPLAVPKICLWMGGWLGLHSKQHLFQPQSKDIPTNTASSIGNSHSFSFCSFPQFYLQEKMLSQCGLDSHPAWVSMHCTSSGGKAALSILPFFPHTSQGYGLAA